MYSFNSIIDKSIAKTISPISLAFVGDAVYSLWIREKLVLSADYRAVDLQKITSKIVSAKGQSALVEQLLPIFTEEEKEIFKRGRNAKKPSHAKNATIADYNRSTGLEAVLGYLYLIGDYQRIDTLLGEKHEN